MVSVREVVVGRRYIARLHRIHYADRESVRVKAIAHRGSVLVQTSDGKSHYVNRSDLFPLPKGKSARK